MMMTVAGRHKVSFLTAFLLAAFCAAASPAHAQTEDPAWLRYASVPNHSPVPTSVRALGTSPLEQSAVEELQRGIPAMIAPKSASAETSGQTVVGTLDEVRTAFPGLAVPTHIAAHGFWLKRTLWHGHPLVVVAGSNEHGSLFGAFDLLRRVTTGADLSHLDAIEAPAMPIRWVDEWDNADGTVTRGYDGRSIFFEAGKVRDDLSEAAAYARLLASVGINGCNVNNVNGADPFLAPAMIKGLARIADAMRPWGVRLAISVDIASPQKVGGLKTFDPLDPQVKAWWTAKLNEIYEQIPDLAGVTVKADSEGEPGPASYGRSPADAANVLANALAPHGGVVLYRAFVYNNHLDYSDMKADRARAAYDIFHPLDGQFAPNVIVQIKYGPIDFQAEEPVSPLFAGLRKTNEAVELQITQEYLGQQRHLVYLAPLWKEKLDFDLRADHRSTPVKEIIEGKSFKRSLGGMIGVSCVGRDNWLGAPMAMANLYAFGRLAWNPNLSADQIAAEWTRQTISTNPEVVATVDKMLMQSWPAYIDYTGFLGTQTLTDITGSHYGPNIEASERNGWGQWHRDDAKGIGMDRSVATGTGFSGQYPPPIARMYESLSTTPDSLLLFFHHVPWTYKLHSGKTVIQYVYDSHYKGAEEAARLGDEWATLKGKIDPQLYEDERARLEYQAGHAIVWRDAIVQYFLKESGVPDALGRAGHYPGRLEAEDARLTGYKIIDVTPWEDASGGKAVSCDPKSAQKTCTAEWTYQGKPGRFDIAAQYFDLQGGDAHFTFAINGTEMVSWAADGKFPSRRPNGDNSTRFTARGPDGRGFELKSGDVLRIEGAPDASDPAALDYVEVEPAHQSAAPALPN
ncbi:MAG TPA: alpha-glucuronidase family glycosyl hydrolase [Terracidiphilus sp.]|jgi:alpha-glucuronidase